MKLWNTSRAPKQRSHEPADMQDLGLGRILRSQGGRREDPWWEFCHWFPSCPYLGGSFPAVMARTKINVVILLPYCSAVRSNASCTHLYVSFVLSSSLFHVYENHVSLSTTEVIFPIEERLSFLPLSALKYLVDLWADPNSSFFIKLWKVYSTFP